MCSFPGKRLNGGSQLYQHHFEEYNHLDYQSYSTQSKVEQVLVRVCSTAVGLSSRKLCKGHGFDSHRAFFSSVSLYHSNLSIVRQAPLGDAAMLILSKN